MDSLSNKIIGWVLTAISVAMILGVIIVSYNIFTGAISAPQIFKIENQPVEQACPKLTESAGNSQQLQAMQEEVKKIIEGQLKEQIKEFFPPEFIAKILNLGAWTLFAWIVFLAGGRISSIGIKLIKNKTE